MVIQVEPFPRDEVESGEEGGEVCLDGGVVNGL